MTTDAPIRIAMWSGPRNISTALLRSWGNRPDTVVCDEPLYAYYLVNTPVDHPGRDEVIASQPNDWRDVVAELTGPIPGGKRIYYQKHMTHHLLPEIERDWLARVTNAFLIRDPREMLPSLLKVFPDAALMDTGIPQQVEIFDWVRTHTGKTPPVIDSRDVLTNPRATLGALCDALNVPFDDAMLSWPPGRRDTDGVWAKHWYHNVEKTTTFEPYTPKSEPIADHHRPIVDRCHELYHRLHAVRLRP